MKKLMIVLLLMSSTPLIASSIKLDLVRVIKSPITVKCYMKSNRGDWPERYATAKGDIIYRVVSEVSGVIKYELFQKNNDGEFEIYASCDDIGA